MIFYLIGHFIIISLFIYIATLQLHFPLGTIEEKIDLMLSDKQKMSDMIVGSDESWLGKLDTSSFLELIKLQSDMVVQNEAA